MLGLLIASVASAEQALGVWASAVLARGSIVEVHGLRPPPACGIVPDRSRPEFPALEGRLLTTGPARKSLSPLIQTSPFGLQPLHASLSSVQ